jgi:hypothetical protein
MKIKTLILASTTAVIALGFSSCKKTSDNTPVDTSTAPTIQATSDQSTSDNITDDANNAMNENVSELALGYAMKGGPVTQNPSTCATVTVPGGGFPKTITIVFTNCSSTWNPLIVRNGTVNIYINDSLRKVGSYAQMTFSGYTVNYLGTGNTYQVEGTYTWTNTGGVPGVSRSWDRTVAGGRITNTSNGHYWTHSGFRHLTQNLNGTPFDPSDDTFTVAAGGYHTITSSTGITHNDTIVSTLVRTLPCRWIHQGSIKISGPYHSAVLDFGYNPNNTTCDDDASYTIDGTTVVYFHLP